MLLGGNTKEWDMLGCYNVLSVRCSEWPDLLIKSMEKLLLYGLCVLYRFTKHGRLFQNPDSGIIDIAHF